MENTISDIEDSTEDESIDENGEIKINPKDMEEDEEETSEEETEKTDDESDETEESEEEAEIEESTEDSEAKSTTSEKVYDFDGRKMSADELYINANLLKAEFTRKSQALAKEDKVKEEPKEEDLDGYTPEQIQEFKKLLRKTGAIFQEDLSKAEMVKTEKSILANFEKKHPEYREPQKMNELFTKLKKYNVDLEYLEENLENAHIDLSPKNSLNDLELAEAKAKANKTKLSRASTGVNSGGKTIVNSPSNLSSSQIKVMKEMGVWEE